MKAAALLTLLLASGCTCTTKETPRGGYFEADPQHPWNRVFHALFDRERGIAFGREVREHAAGR